MARMRERIFAGFGAVLFLGSASALTVFAISQGGSSPDTVATQTCTEQPVSAASETVPEVYKPDDAVTSLQTTDLTAGSGPAVKAGDCLQVKYYGTLASDGSVFDENFDAATAFQFEIGASPAQVIEGWDQGVLGMKVGATRRLVVPAALAYKDQVQAKIPANSDLVFVVKLLKIQK